MTVPDISTSNMRANLYEGQTYDASENTVSGTVVSGNPISYYNGTRWSFDWSDGRKLISAESDDYTLSFEYDQAGIRTSKTVDGVVHDYIYASGRLMRETITNTDGSTIVLDFFYDSNGRPYAMKYNGDLLYYVTNLQGDVVALIDNTDGSARATYTYDAWGNIESSSGDMAEKNPLRYRGYYYDAETGFYYLQSRYYDPAICRFINADNVVPISGSPAQAYNLFAYGFNNPVNYSDSSGNWPELSTVFATVALVAVTVAVAAATVATLAVAAPATVAIGGILVNTAAVATAATTVATQALAISVTAATAAAVNKKIEKSRTRTYSVYFLEDENGTIQYVGRVTDSGYTNRMAYHYRTRELTPKYRISGLSYAEARGLEEIGMIECHTLNALNPQNNQIRGIGPRNNNAARYMSAATNYLLNHTENFLLNVIQ